MNEQLKAALLKQKTLLMQAWRTEYYASLSGSEDEEQIAKAWSEKVQGDFLATLQPEIERLMVEARIDELQRQRLRLETPEQIYSADGIHKRPGAEGRNSLKAKEIKIIDVRIARLTQQNPKEAV